MEKITENGAPALGTTLAEFAERYQSAADPELRSVVQTDHLQQVMTAGRLPPEFLGEWIERFRKDGAQKQCNWTYVCDNDEMRVLRFEDPFGSSAVEWSLERGLIDVSTN